MKILTINTYDVRGGAAIAASRLLTGLIKYHGAESRLLVGEKRSSTSQAFGTRRNKAQHYFEFALDNLTNTIGLQYFFFPFSSREIMRQAVECQPDIIYLRNLHGGYFALSLLRKLSEIAPLVWTLSDMWSFTGNCAHTFGDESWADMRECQTPEVYPPIGVNTGKWLLKRKRNIYRNSNINVVCPSKWLHGLASRSPVFKGKDIVQIYNGFDLDTFSPKDKDACRKALSIPGDAKVVMFCAESLVVDLWKGGRELLSALEEINGRSPEKVHILLVGDGCIRELKRFDKLQTHQVGALHSDTLMAACYSAADLFMYPTKADNLPNVLIEAVSCGTPCLTFDVGGCAEIVKDGITGWVLAPGDARGLAEKTMTTLEDEVLLKRLSLAARADAEKRFSLARMCDDYHNYFLKVAGVR